MKAEELTENVDILDGVTATADANILTVKGEKGEVQRHFPSRKVLVTTKDGVVTVCAKKATAREKKLLYTFRAHIRNMLRGVKEGHMYKLKICSGHFPMNASVKGNTFEVKNFIGEAVPRVMPILEGVDVKVEGDIITVTGINKELVGQVAGRIENLTKRPGFDMRIFQDGIYLTEKDGKTL
ncbi:50S ribosomal protein L6 [Candidatus Woesearchaeota archaeon]|nr:50S ribosomal protein L6 [Candidatus Woesearchaeota archaeon]